MLLKTTIGLIVPDRGDVLIDGESVYAATREQLADDPPQGRLRVPVRGALRLDERVRERRHAACPRATPSKLGAGRGACAGSRRSLEDVNLDPAVVLTKLPAELSGGMRKRVGLARAIVGEPQILLYDEPVTGLDPVNAAAVDRLITRDRASARGVTSIVVTHDIEGALEISDRVALLDARQAALRGHAGRVPRERRPPGARLRRPEGGGGSGPRRLRALAAASRRPRTRGPVSRCPSTATWRHRTDDRT